MKKIPENITKEMLWNIAMENVKVRHSQTQDSIQKLQRDLSNEQKSTAGDKYETGRAMIHAEMDRLAIQLSTILEERNFLDYIFNLPQNEKISAGSIVLLKDRLIFFSIGIGNEIIDETTVSFVSAKSPLGIQLLGKKIGDSVLINKQNLVILDVR